ncbi:hypothetical protein P5673_010598 [Acropora cervicornis]|uniref:Uncharacterized protein n=1 Tax=Acropora cervicornis TaxID=6130 RepID=A0AAD9QQA1_ACRCE|nr:hypothetical protein P5673_010598 [Acropora cervicornis]
MANVVGIRGGKASQAKGKQKSSSSSIGYLSLIHRTDKRVVLDKILGNKPQKRQKKANRKIATIEGTDSSAVSTTFKRLADLPVRTNSFSSLSRSYQTLA